MTRGLLPKPFSYSGPVSTSTANTSPFALQFKTTENIYRNWEHISFLNPSESSVGTLVYIYNGGLLKTHYKKIT